MGGVCVGQREHPTEDSQNMGQQKNTPDTEKSLGKQEQRDHKEEWSQDWTSSQNALVPAQALSSHVKVLSPLEKRGPQ